MRPTRLLTAIICILVASSQAHAWNYNGHMIVASLAYRDLKETNPAVLTKIRDLLKKHPHYEEYLLKDRPNGVPEAEWMFLRASTWPDWIRPPGPESRLKYHIGERHYINRALVRVGDEDKVDKDKVKEFREENILSGLKNAMKRLGDRTAPEEELAVDLCWLLHLAGDVHQPLHCRSMYSSEFPKGDLGGNLFHATNGGKTIKLHAFWDDILSADGPNAYAAVDNVTTAIQRSADFERAKFKERIARDKPEDWVEESAALAEEVVYRKGKLEGINLPARQKERIDVRLPALPEGYEKAGREFARKQAAIAGYRISDRLVKLFKE